ncbi:MAG: DUF6299 family protein [Actinomycetes bacterium]
MLDTTEATTDAEDAQLNTECGAPATDASVWYSFTSASDAGVVVDVSASDYSAGVLVGVGAPGTLELVTCGPGTVGFFAAAGTTYWVLAIDDQGDGAGNGGSLNISFGEVPPPPTVDITVDPTARVTRTGVATLTGTYTCSDGDFIEVFAEVSQSVGRFFILRGSFDFFDEGTCDGTPHRWSADVVADNGRFAGGKAMAVVFTFSCGAFECSEGFSEHTVKLRGGGR